MRDGKLHATERQVKGLLRGRQVSRINAQIPELKDAAEVIEKLAKRVERLEGEIAMYRSRYDKMFRWCMEEGMRFDADVAEDR